MVYGLTGTSGSAYDPLFSFPKNTRDNGQERIQEPGTVDTETFPSSKKPGDKTDPTTAGKADLTSKLQSTDTAVRAHEAAHMAAGGSAIRGGASYTYQIGPDGKSYAIGGEVGVDLSPVPGNPQATITKMMMVRAAALAPADPSPQDLSVAAAAAQIEAAARTQLSAQNQAQLSKTHATGKTAAIAYRAQPRPTGRHVNLVA